MQSKQFTRAVVAALLLAAWLPVMAAEVTVSSASMQVEHITMSSPKPSAAVQQNLEARLGKLGPDIRQLAANKQADALRVAVEKAAGKDGLA